MSIDALIANPGRLKILTSLAAENRQEFVRLRQTTQLTDGNLSAHAQRLRMAGLLDIQKTFREGKPVTTLTMTDTGRRRLTEHVNTLIQAMTAVPAAASQSFGGTDEADNWVD